MKKPKFWWALIVFLVAWSLWSMYPPTSENLITAFNEQADQSKLDTTFKAIVDKAQAMEKANPDPHREFGDLMSAIGTNNIQPYFPYIDVTNEEHPTYALLNMLQRKVSGKIKLGIDLQGGTQFLVSLDTNHMVTIDTNGNKVVPMESEERQRLVSQAAEVLRRRVDNLGVAEPVIQPAGESHIMIQLPGLTQANQDEAKKNIQRAAYLEFRLVDPDSAQLIKEGIIPPGYEVLKLKKRMPDGTFAISPYLVQKKLADGLTGKYVKRAFPSRDMVSNDPVVELQFDSEGADKFYDVTSKHVGDQLAIVLDGELYSAPVIQGPIRGNCEISGGNMDINEAITIANILENPLETPVKIDEMSEVDPTLGKDSIKSGINAAAFGTFFVALFMAVYYHRCGIIADIAMILNLIILLGVMCSIGTTLTLPGIAGIVLTVGMAVDANVLIYERLREELAQSKSVRGALSAAYSRAFTVIFDSHTTTLISAIILIYLGTGPVKGFGVTLTIGVALSLFTSLVMTRLIFDFLLARGWLNKIGMFHLIKNKKWDFMKYAKPAFIASWTIIIVGMCYGIFVRGNNVLGIDFAGGDAVKMSFSQNDKIDVDKLRSALKPVGDTQIQYQRGANQEMLEVVAPFNKGNDVTNVLMKAFPSANFHQIGHETVGATVGVEIQKSAIIASFLSLFGILVYVAFRYEFSFSVGAVLAVIHDVFMTLGIFFLSGRQLSAPIVAAILTIIGFSVNDTIVIFDRIREDLKLGVRGTFKEVMNVALNQTLSRTLITSGTVFIATFSLYMFGGGVINDFAFTFLIGIITGTYSSIYIASALVLWWHKGERPKSASQVVMEEGAGVRARA
ncbi:MAG TPA: protein translocase subunit SecD [Verrucomicrobiae bacterium]|nr:protein translocase subunit SecD [Verrucomicrobiae bacterium]